MDTKLIETIVQSGTALAIAWKVIEWGKGYIESQRQQIKEAYEEAVKALKDKEDELKASHEETISLMRDTINNNTAALHEVATIIQRCPMSGNGQTAMNLKS